jgi:isochorismate synthase
VYNTDKSEFIKWCQDTLVKIKKGELEKAVLSAITVHKPATHLSPLCLFEKLSKAYPNVFVYFAHDMHTGCWLGATPELLLQYNDQQIKTVSLAGTRHDEGVLQQSMWSEKEIKEQELVTKHIIKCFQNYFSEPLHVSETKTISTGHLLHLRTDFSMHFSDSYFNKSLSDFLLCLHPTPAVSGSPKTAAIQHISRTELHKREYYTGFVGPVNLHEHSYLFVNLRCFKHNGDQLIIYTGAGITDGSTPEKEWEEVQLKAQTILKIL